MRKALKRFEIWKDNLNDIFLKLGWKFHNLDSFKDAILRMPPQKFLALFFSGGQGFEVPFPFRGRGGCACAHIRDDKSGIEGPCRVQD